MSYVKCYSVYPDCFRIAHDISIESFTDSLPDEGDEGIVCENDLNSDLNNADPSSSYSSGLTDSYTESDLNFNNNKPIPNDLTFLNGDGFCDKYREITTNSIPNNYTPGDTVKTLNLKNSAHIHLYDECETERKFQAQQGILERKISLRGLKIEDVERIGRDCVTLNLAKEKVEGRIEVGELKCEAELQHTSHEGGNEGEENSTSLLHEIQRCDSSESQKSSSYEDSPTSECSSGHRPSSRGSVSSGKRWRRPRKLPEIPTNATARKVPTSLPLKQSVSVQSLAEELQEADPTLKCNVSHGALRTSHSCHEHAELTHGLAEKASSSQAAVLNILNDLGSPEVIDPANKYLLDIQGIRTEKTIVESETSHHEEFCEHCEYIDDEPKCKGSDIRLNKDRHLNDDFHEHLKFDTTSNTSRAFLSSSNPYVKEDSSHLQGAGKKNGSPVRSKKTSPAKCTKKESPESGGSPRKFTLPTSFACDLEDLETTHRGCHKFIPRHSDEMFIEIGDPIYVEEEADDLWCEGVNLRTGYKGVFPAAYATDLSMLEENDGTPRKFFLQFLGSVEVNYHKGNEVLTQAIHKVALTRRMTLNTAPPPIMCLEIDEYGIRMTEKSKRKKQSKASSPVKALKARLSKILQKEKADNDNHFFSLKNISFCGYHPKNEKYFAFITKHPLELRFACHVFLAEKSTRVIAEAVGEAFKRFYQEYMAFVHPTEDIYLE